MPQRSKNFENEIRKLKSGHPPDADAGIFGASIDPFEAGLILLGVPWDVTCSYGRGSAAAPDAIREASHQLDFADDFFGPAYEMGISLLPEDRTLRRLYRKGKVLAEKMRSTPMKPSSQKHRATLEAVNALSHSLSQRVFEICVQQGREKKFVGVIGGEHSVPLGLIRALAESHDHFGIVHIDAHLDLRDKYEGFSQSHASIMNNVMTHISQVDLLLQIGIRDYSLDEVAFAKSLGERSQILFAGQLFRQRAQGVTYAHIVAEKISLLPEKVYLSFDIDGLDPSLCPSTGTPVPGGLSFYEAVFILEELVRQKKKIIGFDLCEVVPHPKSSWDANVAARILYKMCCCVYATQMK